jgi:hypothetical protein
MAVRAFPAGPGPGAPERRSRAGPVLVAGAGALAASAVYNTLRARRVEREQSAPAREFGTSRQTILRVRDARPAS